jgi:hemoglobin-like flavoprotein
MNPETVALVRQSWSAILPMRREVCGDFYQPAKFETVLLDTLHQALGDQFSAETRIAWGRVYERLVEIMRVGAGDDRIR